MNPKRYEIENIADIFLIPEESFDNFLIDLKAYYRLGRSIPGVIDAIAATRGVGTITKPRKLTWLDDGKHDAHVTLNVERKEEETT